jgi:signal transduction histidine kinase
MQDADGRHESGHEGSGVGLALVRRIVDLHHGRVWVESEGARRGTTMCFTLPDAPASGAVAASG